MDKSDKEIKETISKMIEILNNRLKNFETILNNFPILNSQFTQTLQSLGSLQESLKEVNSLLSNSSNQQTRILQAFQNLPLLQESFLSSLQFPLIQALQNLNSQYSQIIQTFQKSVSLQEFLKEIVRRNELSRVVMIESGWWLTPSLMELPVEYIDSAVQQYDNGDKKAISELFKAVYQNDNCKYLREVVSGWEVNPYFKSWMTIINDALEAHINGKYTLSIPALLIGSSGIARDYCKENVKEDKERNKDRSKDGEIIKEALKFRREEFKEDDLRFFLSDWFLEDLFFRAIDEFIYGDTNNLERKGISPENILNRHAIFHGINKNYATCENSIRGFMLLDILSLLK